MATTDNMAKEMAIELMRLMIADKSRDEIEAEIFRIFPTATQEDYKLAFVKVQQFVDDYERVKARYH